MEGSVVTDGLCMLTARVSVLCRWVCGIWHSPASLKTAPAFATCEADDDSAGSRPDVPLMLLLGALSLSRPSNSSQPGASRLWLGLRPPRLPGLLCFLLWSPWGLSHVSGPVAHPVKRYMELWPLPRPSEGVERDADVPGAAAKVPSSPPQAGVQAKPPFKPVIAGAHRQPPTPWQAPSAPQEGSLRDLFPSQMCRCVNAKEADPYRAPTVLQMLICASRWNVFHPHSNSMRKILLLSLF